MDKWMMDMVGFGIFVMAMIWIVILILVLAGLLFGMLTLPFRSKHSRSVHPNDHDDKPTPEDPAVPIPCSRCRQEITIPESQKVLACFYVCQDCVETTIDGWRRVKPPIEDVCQPPA